MRRLKDLSRPPHFSNICSVKYLLSYYSFCNDKKGGYTPTNYAGFFSSCSIRACALALRLMVNFSPRMNVHFNRRHHSTIMRNLCRHLPGGNIEPVDGKPMGRHHGELCAGCIPVCPEKSDSGWPPYRYPAVRITWGTTGRLIKEGAVA
jgi:hypothetical protein